MLKPGKFLTAVERDCHRWSFTNDLRARDNLQAAILVEAETKGEFYQHEFICVRFSGY